MRWQVTCNRLRSGAAALWIPALIGVALAAPARAVDDADPTLSELVDILRAEGVIDEDQHADMKRKAARRQDVKDWTDRVRLWGHLRTRYESFFFENDVYSKTAAAADPTGESGLRDRHRVRYRGHLNLGAELASRAQIAFRLVSGDADPRSADQTLGAPGPDFDKDDVRFDLAYATLSPFPDQELPGVENGYLAADIGKVPNAFRWGALGPDNMIWDSDITLEGGNLRIKGDLGPVSLFSHSGAYVIDENSGAKDPKLVASQLGGSVTLSDSIEFGGRGSVYHFFSLDDDFFTRAAAFGNIADSLSSANASIQVLEGSLFTRFGFFENWPVLVFFNYAHNLSARTSDVFPGLGREDDAYGIGVWVGDHERSVLLGATYYFIEANAFPAMLIDSDNTDGLPNRHGWAWILRRELIDGIDFYYTAYLMDRIRGGLPFAVSGRASERFRMRADLVFSF